MNNRRVCTSDVRADACAGVHILIWGAFNDAPNSNITLINSMSCDFSCRILKLNIYFQFSNTLNYLPQKKNREEMSGEGLCGIRRIKYKFN